MNFQQNLLLFFVILITSCTTNNLRSIPEIQESNQISFPLDSVSPFLTFSLEYNDQKDYITLYNDITNSIDFYSLINKNLFRRIFLKEKGADSIGKKGLLKISHHVINDNSIAVYNKNTNSIYIIDSLGKVKNRIKIDWLANNTINEIHAVPDPFPGRPMIYKDSTIYMVANIIDNSIRDERAVKNVLMVDLKTKKITWLFNRSNTYNKGNWGINGNMYSLQIGYNREKDEFYLGYSAEDSVYVVTGNWKIIKKISTKSVSINNIKPLLARRKTAKKRESIKYDYTTPQYHRLIYDPYRKYIYRFTYQGLSDPEFDKGGEELMYGRQETIIILNDKFKIIGEYRLPKRIYFTSMSFVTKDGLYLAKKSNYKRNSELLEFGLFKF